MVNIPNMLSIFRIGAAPALLLLAVLGNGKSFIALYAAAMVSDAADGLIARKLHQKSPWGAKLDSAGDMAILIVLPISVWLLWPQIILEETAYIVTGLVAYFIPTALAVLKFGRFPSYHTWGAKTVNVAVSVSLMIMFSGGPRWPFHVCVPLMLLEAVEEIVMTAVLPVRHTDVPSVWHALKIAREERRPGR